MPSLQLYPFRFRDLRTGGGSLSGTSYRCQSYNGIIPIGRSTGAPEVLSVTETSARPFIPFEPPQPARAVRSTVRSRELSATMISKASRSGCRSRSADAVRLSLRIVRSDHDGGPNSWRRPRAIMAACVATLSPSHRLQSRVDRCAVRLIISAAVEWKPPGQERRDREAGSPRHEPDDSVSEHADHGWPPPPERLPGKQPERAHIADASRFYANADQDERGASARREEVCRSIGPG